MWQDGVKGDENTLPHLLQMCVIPQGFPPLREGDTVGVKI